jgi:hypothetical protein
MNSSQISKYKIKKKIIPLSKRKNHKGLPSNLKYSKLLPNQPNNLNKTPFKTSGVQHGYILRSII